MLSHPGLRVARRPLRSGQVQALGQTNLERSQGGRLFRRLVRSHPCCCCCCCLAGDAQLLVLLVLLLVLPMLHELSLLRLLTLLVLTNIATCCCVLVLLSNADVGCACALSDETIEPSTRQRRVRIVDHDGLTGWVSIATQANEPILEPCQRQPVAAGASHRGSKHTHSSGSRAPDVKNHFSVPTSAVGCTGELSRHCSPARSAASDDSIHDDSDDDIPLSERPDSDVSRSARSSKGIVDAATTKTAVTKAEASCIIGQGGCNINLIRKASGASIMLSQSGSKRTVTLSGTQVQVAAADKLIRDRLAGKGTDQSNITIQNTDVGCIMGNRGCIMADIQKASGASSISLLQPQSGCNERTVSLTGTQEQIAAAEQLIQQKTREHNSVSNRRSSPARDGHCTAASHSKVPSPRRRRSKSHGVVTKKLSVANTAAGRIIGKSGCNIFELEERSGASITVSAIQPRVAGENLCPERTVIVAGTQAQVTSASRLIQQYIDGADSTNSNSARATKNSVPSRRGSPARDGHRTGPTVGSRGGDVSSMPPRLLVVQPGERRVGDRAREEVLIPIESWAIGAPVTVSGPHLLLHVTPTVVGSQHS